MQTIYYDWVTNIYVNLSIYKALNVKKSHLHSYIAISCFSMECIIFLMFLINVLTNEIHGLTASKILYVWPNNSANTSCSSQPCSTLSQHILDNGTLPDVTNVEYHFLPGEHRIPANIVLKNLHNFSIIGIVSKPSLQVVLVGCVHTHVLRIIMLTSKM